MCRCARPPHGSRSEIPARAGECRAREALAARLPSSTVLEYRYGLLNIQYRSGLEQLDVWCMRKVLSAERFAGKPQITHYAPGYWERHLIEAAEVAA